MSDFKKLSVIGAGGKMGSGILLLLLTFLAEENGYELMAIDTSSEALKGLKKYLRNQLIRHAEKNINLLRQLFANNATLVSNQEIIEAFVSNTLEKVDYSTRIEDAKGSLITFEAAVENVSEKINIFKKIKEVNPSTGWFLTNTSSIPIHVLNEQASLQGRIAGFHFYNPPAVQKLVEVIELDDNPNELKQLMKELIQKLNKISVYSRDVAGFIGNGYFMREIVFACHLAKDSEAAIQELEIVTKDFLLRPMGIFQLMDYVGLDVVKNILTIMQTYLDDDSLHIPLIDQWLANGIKGGQTFGGEQKNGIFRYENGKPMEIFSLQKQNYVPLKNVNVGDVPFGLTWKSLNKNFSAETLDRYFLALKNEDSKGAKLARDFLKKGKEISEFLVSSGVAHSLEDVAKVLKYGFYHLYGPQDI